MKPYSIKHHAVIRVFIAGGIALLCLWSLSTAKASEFNLQVQGPLLELHAEEAPLIDILTALSDNFGFLLKTGDPMTETVSLDLKGVTIEAGLKKLLGNRNYALTFTKNEASEIVPVSLFVFGESSLTVVAKPVSEPPSPDPMKRFEREWFSRAFGEPENLQEQITAENTEDDYGQNVMRITRLSDPSVFRQIGLKEGDTIGDINGRRVKTSSEFIKAVQESFNKESSIRIERTNESSQMDPIYIELH